MLAQARERLLSFITKTRDLHKKSDRSLTDK